MYLFKCEVTAEENVLRWVSFTNLIFRLESEEFASNYVGGNRIINVSQKFI